MEEISLQPTLISKLLQVLFRNIYRYHFRTSAGIISKLLQVLFQNICRCYFKISTGIFFKTSTGIISKHLQVSFKNICRYYFKTLASIISKHLQVLFQNIHWYYFCRLFSKNVFISGAYSVDRSICGRHVCVFGAVGDRQLADAKHSTIWCYY